MAELDTVAGKYSVSHVVKRPNFASWGISAVFVLLLAGLISALAANEKMRWDLVLANITTTSVLQGVGMTLLLTVISMTIGVVVGVVIAVCRLGNQPVLRVVASAYIWFFRGVPTLVQLIIWFNLAIIFERVSIGIPFGPEFFAIDVNDLITPFSAAILGLGLHEAAYMAEIIRAGVLSIDRGQKEAAESLGMKPSMTFFRIVLPQAMRSIVPPTGNQIIGMLKATSLVSVIAMADLLYSVQAIYNRNFQTIPLLIVATIWYLILVSILSFAQSNLEQYYGRGFGKDRGSRQPAASEPAAPETSAVPQVPEAPVLLDKVDATLSVGERTK